MDAVYPRAALTARLAWATTFIVLLALGALLLDTTTASAAAPSAHPAFEDQEELEEEEEEEEVGTEEPDWDAEGWEEEELGGADCELGHEALAEGLLSITDVEELCAAEVEWEEELEGRSPPGRNAGASCALRSAKAHVVTRRNHLKLTVGYAVAAPTKVRIEVRAGKRKLTSVERRLGHRGVIRLSKRVGERLGRQLGRKNGGKRVRLRIELPKKAAACPSRRLALFAR